jgi:hypothetical protein
MITDRRAESKECPFSLIQAGLIGFSAPDSEKNNEFSEKGVGITRE